MADVDTHVTSGMDENFLFGLAGIPTNGPPPVWPKKDKGSVKSTKSLYFLNPDTSGTMARDEELTVDIYDIYSDGPTDAEKRGGKISRSEVVSSGTKEEFTQNSQVYSPNAASVSYQTSSGLSHGQVSQVGVIQNGETSVNQHIAKSSTVKSSKTKSSHQTSTIVQSSSSFRSDENANVQKTSPKKAKAPSPSKAFNKSKGAFQVKSTGSRSDLTRAGSSGSLHDDAFKQALSNTLNRKAQKSPSEKSFTGTTNRQESIPGFNYSPTSPVSSTTDSQVSVGSSIEQVSTQQSAISAPLGSDKEAGTNASMDTGRLKATAVTTTHPSSPAGHKDARGHNTQTVQMSTNHTSQTTSVQSVTTKPTKIKTGTSVTTQQVRNISSSVTDKKDVPNLDNSNQSAGKITSMETTSASKSAGPGKFQMRFKEGADINHNNRTTTTGVSNITKITTDTDIRKRSGVGDKQNTNVTMTAQQQQRISDGSSKTSLDTWQVSDIGSSMDLTTDTDTLSIASSTNTVSSLLKDESFKSKISGLFAGSGKKSDTTFSAPSSLDRRKKNKFKLTEIPLPEMSPRDPPPKASHLLTPEPEYESNTFPREHKKEKEEFKVVPSTPTSPYEEMKATVSGGTVGRLAMVLKDMPLTGRAIDPSTLERKRTKSAGPEKTPDNGVAEEKKFKFVVEGIDVPASDTNTEVTTSSTMNVARMEMSMDVDSGSVTQIADAEMSDGVIGNKSITTSTLSMDTTDGEQNTSSLRRMEKKGFSYLLDRKLAEDIKRRAGDFTSRKPHEAVEESVKGHQKEVAQRSERDSLIFVEAKAKLQKKDSIRQAAGPEVREPTSPESTLLIEAKSRLNKQNSFNTEANKENIVNNSNAGERKNVIRSSMLLEAKSKLQTRRSDGEMDTSVIKSFSPQKPSHTVAKQNSAEKQTKEEISKRDTETDVVVQNVTTKSSANTTQKEKGYFHIKVASEHTTQPSQSEKVGATSKRYDAKAEVLISNIPVQQRANRDSSVTTSQGRSDQSPTDHIDKVTVQSTKTSLQSGARKQTGGVQTEKNDKKTVLKIEKSKIPAVKTPITLNQKEATEKTGVSVKTRDEEINLSPSKQKRERSTDQVTSERGRPEIKVSKTEINVSKLAELPDSVYHSDNTVSPDINSSTVQQHITNVTSENTCTKNQTSLEYSDNGGVQEQSDSKVSVNTGTESRPVWDNLRQANKKSETSHDNTSHSNTEINYDPGSFVIQHSAGAFDNGDDVLPVERPSINNRTTDEKDTDDKELRVDNLRDGYKKTRAREDPDISGVQSKPKRHNTNITLIVGDPRDPNFRISQDYDQSGDGDDTQRPRRISQSDLIDVALTQADFDPAPSATKVTSSAKQPPSKERQPGVANDGPRLSVGALDVGDLDIFSYGSQQTPRRNVSSPSSDTFELSRKLPSDSQRDVRRNNTQSSEVRAEGPVHISRVENGRGRDRQRVERSGFDGRFDRPEFDRRFDHPEFDRRFERPGYDRRYDRPEYDRRSDRPEYERKLDRPDFDRYAYDRRFDRPDYDRIVDRPEYEGRMGRSKRNPDVYYGDGHSNGRPDERRGILGVKVDRYDSGSGASFMSSTNQNRRNTHPPDITYTDYSNRNDPVYSPGAFSSDEHRTFSSLSVPIMSASVSRTSSMSTAPYNTFDNANSRRPRDYDDDMYRSRSMDRGMTMSPLSISISPLPPQDGPVMMAAHPVESRRSRSETRNPQTTHIYHQEPSPVVTDEPGMFRMSQPSDHAPSTSIHADTGHRQQREQAERQQRPRSDQRLSYGPVTPQEQDPRMRGREESFNSQSTGPRSPPGRYLRVDESRGGRVPVYNGRGLAPRDLESFEYSQPNTTGAPHNTYASPHVSRVNVDRNAAAQQLDGTAALREPVVGVSSGKYSVHRVMEKRGITSQHVDNHPDLQHQARKRRVYQVTGGSSAPSTMRTQTLNSTTSQDSYLRPGPDMGPSRATMDSARVKSPEVTAVVPLLEEVDRKGDKYNISLKLNALSGSKPGSKQSQQYDERYEEHVNSLNNNTMSSTYQRGAAYEGETTNYAHTDTRQASSSSYGTYPGAQGQRQITLVRIKDQPEPPQIDVEGQYMSKHRFKVRHDGPEITAQETGKTVTTQQYMIKSVSQTDRMPPANSPISPAQAPGANNPPAGADSRRFTMNVNQTMTMDYAAPNNNNNDPNAIDEPIQPARNPNNQNPNRHKPNAAEEPIQPALNPNNQNPNRHKPLPDPREGVDWFRNVTVTDAYHKAQSPRQTPVSDRMTSRRAPQNREGTQDPFDKLRDIEEESLRKRRPPDAERPRRSKPRNMNGHGREPDDLEHYLSPAEEPDNDQHSGDIPQVVRGSILIKNSIDTTGGPKVIDVVEGDDSGDDIVVEENVNMFHGSYLSRRENPMYNSDPDLSDWQERKPQQPAFTRIFDNGRTDRYTDIKVNRDPPGPKRKKERRPVNGHDVPDGHDESRTSRQVREHRSEYEVSSLLKDAPQDSIRQSINVEREEEDIIGPLPASHADGAHAKSEDMLNFDTVSEKVDMGLRDGIAEVAVKVRCERIVPIRGVEDMFKKSSVIVTRLIEIDLFATPERRRLWDSIVGRTNHGMIEDGRSRARDAKLSTKDTFNLYKTFMGLAEADDSGKQRERTRIDRRVEDERRPELYAGTAADPDLDDMEYDPDQLDRTLEDNLNYRPRNLEPDNMSYMSATSETHDMLY